MKQSKASTPTSRFRKEITVFVLAFSVFLVLLTLPRM